MATKTASAQAKSIPAPDDPAAVIRQELRLIRDEIADQGRRVAFGAALIGGAGVLGLGAFGALTTAAITALGRKDTMRGALLMAAAYGAGAGALAEVGVLRLRRVTPEAVENVQAEVKEAARNVRRVT